MGKKRTRPGTRKRAKPAKGKRIVGEVVDVTPTKNTYKLTVSFPYGDGISKGTCQIYFDKGAYPGGLPEFTTLTIE